MRKLLCVTLTSLFLFGCDLWPQNSRPKADPILKRFDSPAALAEYFRAQVRNRYSYRGGIGWTLLPMNFSFLGAAAPDVAAQDVPADAGAYSTTNLQEAGVDEADVIKNDGEYFYVLTDDVLRIVRASPADSLQQLATVQLEYSGTALYLYGDTIIALLSDYGEYEDDIRLLEASIGSSEVRTAVVIVNVADRTQPLVRKTFLFDGDLVSSRMIGSKLHVILSMYPELPEGALSTLTGAIALDDWLPRYEAVAGDGAIQTGNLAEWDDFYHPEDPDGYGVTAIVTVDVADPDAGHESVAVVADRGIIYASVNALYLTDTEYDFDNNFREDTAIHKFDLTGDGGAEYVASGSVPGRLLNQFSLGEHEGFLRVATTTGSFFGGENNVAKNHVFVLGENEARLTIVGRIEDSAPGEEIYAARFIGTRGFLVTFEKIDPFFTLNLSDPTQPKLIGEWKGPGYSDYIHPMGENHLLTIGKDAEDVGDFSWYQGVQLSLFDVTDFANPALVDNLILGTRGTESEACHDHKAFNYFAPQKLLAIPIYLVEGGSGGPEIGQHTFTGLYVFRVTAEKGFKLLGRISTDDAQDQDYWWGWYEWTRSVFIADIVHVVTADGIQASPIDQVGKIVGSVEF